MSDLITKRAPIEDFNSVYNNIDNKNNIATIFSYELKEEESFNNIITLNNANFKSEYPVFGIIGAGNFTKMTLLPVMTKIDAKIKTIASIGGLNSTELARKYNISQSTSDYELIINDKDINTVIITTKHNSHSELVLKCLEAGKHVFVEKPLSINRDQLKLLHKYFYKNDKLNSKKRNNFLMVGFNRRFSPHMSN